ncbi:MAG: fluoride efflux transporter CrcB [Pseudomonadota bacterium]
MENYLAIALGGALGAVLRYSATLALGGLGARGFPWATLSVNVVGSFCLGLLALYLSSRSVLSEPVRHGLLIGLLGAFTTFSTFSMDLWLLVEEGAWLRAISYALASVGICLLAVGAGAALGRHLT